MVVDRTRRLFDWGDEIQHEGDGDVIALDFRDAGRIRAALIAVKKAFALGVLVPHLIANAFNGRRAADIESAVESSGVPCVFVRRTFSMSSGERSQDASSVSDARESVAMVVTDDGAAGRIMPAASNHEIARALSRIAKRPVIYVDVPENIARQSMRQLGMPPSLIEGLLQHALSG